MPQKNIVAFDLDGVLFPLFEVFVAALNERFKLKLRAEDCDFYSMRAWLETYQQKVYTRLEANGGVRGHLKWLEEREMLVETPPYEGVVDTLKRIKRRDMDIALVTVRSSSKEPGKFYKDGPGNTIRWLEKHRIPYDYIIFTEEKDVEIKRLEATTGGRVVVYIEDLPKHVMAVTNAGYRVVVVDKPYNRREILNNERERKSRLGPYPEADWHRLLDLGLVGRIRSISEIESILTKN